MLFRSLKLLIKIKAILKLDSLTSALPVKELPVLGGLGLRKRRMVHARDTGKHKALASEQPSSSSPLSSLSGILSGLESSVGSLT